MFRTRWQNRQHFSSYLLDRQPAINFAQQASLPIKSNQRLVQKNVYLRGKTLGSGGDDLRALSAKSRFDEGIDIRRGWRNEL